VGLTRPPKAKPTAATPDVAASDLDGVLRFVPQIAQWHAALLVHARGVALQVAVNLLGLERDEDAVLKEASNTLCESMGTACGQSVMTWHGTGLLLNASIRAAASTAAR
jgi:hypothetical protein